jgi:hypothetical protein
MEYNTKVDLEVITCLGEAAAGSTAEALISPFLGILPQPDLPLVVRH